MPKPRILVVDDEKNIRKTLSLVLEGEGYDVSEAASAEEAHRLLENDGTDLMILDVKLPGMSGLDLLQKIRSGPPNVREVPIIMISGHASLSEAVDAVKNGATDFFEKPLDRSGILIRVSNCLKQHRLTKEVESLRASAPEYQNLLGNTPAMARLKNQIEKIAPTQARVLITGESGTGKELIARAIHRLSSRASEAFIKVNCAAIPSELIESELFGHERGAFTGAAAKKPGQFELADGGTLFLDEIGDMSLNAQAKVLRALQSGEITRVGGQKTITVDVRVLAATNKNLEEAVRTGAFREDLYFRLNVLPIVAPPLRDRVEDIQGLFAHFSADFCKSNGFREKPADPEVLASLTAYHWPGNVRELKNLTERLIILSGDRITREDLPDDFCGPLPLPSGTAEQNSGRLTLRDFRDSAERSYIISTLEDNDWNISKTAHILGIERTNLHKKMKNLGLARGNGPLE